MDFCYNHCAGQYWTVNGHQRTLQGCPGLWFRRHSLDVSSHQCAATSRSPTSCASPSSKRRLYKITVTGVHGSCETRQPRRIHRWPRLQERLSWQCGRDSTKRQRLYPSQLRQRTQLHSILRAEPILPLARKNKAESRTATIAVTVTSVGTLLNSIATARQIQWKNDFSTANVEKNA